MRTRQLIGGEMVEGNGGAPSRLILRKTDASGGGMSRRARRHVRDVYGFAA